MTHKDFEQEFRRKHAEMSVLKTIFSFFHEFEKASLREIDDDLKQEIIDKLMGYKPFDQK